MNASASNKHSKIIFSSIQPSYYDIYLFNGNIPKRITESRSLEYNPIFSPDGRYIVFTSEKGGMAHLYLMDTKNPKQPPARLTDGGHFEDQAAFTPDGKNILFVSARDGFANIYKMPFRPGKVLKLNDATNLTHSKGGNFHPAVSPDGKWIAFSSNRSFVAPVISTPQPHKNFLATNIHIMRIDGTAIRKITNNPAWDGSPAWSPDGQYIYFYSTRDGKPRIYILRAGII